MFREICEKINIQYVSQVCFLLQKKQPLNFPLTFTFFALSVMFYSLAYAIAM